jgi:hypothetical protein
MSRYRIRRLERIEGLASQRQHQAEMEGLQALTESTRARLINYLELSRNGQPLPVLRPSADHDSPARERLRRRLNETRERLIQFSDVRERMP